MIPGALLSDFRRTLFAGGYNMLLGAGVSLDSRNGAGRNIEGAPALQARLCALKGVPATTSLSRVSALLTDDERREQLVEPYSNCAPADTLLPVTQYLWRRVFTLNVDDVLENLYTPESKQTLVPLNYNAAFEPTPERDTLQAIHLHGWVRDPTTPFVFSRNDYARITRELNPWMLLLSQILSTESFIIAGTTLDEPDLEYYLSSRSEETPRRSRGPSLLIDPFPNPATVRDCERHGLILVTGTLGEFLDWLSQQFPNAPTVADLLIPDTRRLFAPGLSNTALLRFFSDFQPVTASDRELPPLPSPFLYGREPTWADIDEHADIERNSYTAISNAVDEAFSNRARPRLIIVTDEPGTGKTTATMRVAHDAVVAGRTVLQVMTPSRIDTAGAINCLSQLRSEILIHVDGLADHAEQILEILEADRITSRLVILSSERAYRADFLNATFAGMRTTLRGVGNVPHNEARQLVQRYEDYGLTAAREARINPGRFARNLQGEPIAISVCHILDDFRPIRAMVESLWQAASPEDQLGYLAVALAHHCYSQGIAYSILQKILGPGTSVARMYQADRPLRVVENAMNDDYVVPLQGVVAERIIVHAEHAVPDLLFKTFVDTATELAPQVNRRAVMKRTPEARLAGRLFDADKIVRPMLGHLAERFYLAVKNDWAWNSRYWEQRALLVADSDIEAAVRHARHAVATERHPHTLTTLGKILFKVIDANSRERNAAFTEGFEVLNEAILNEVQGARITIHPYAALVGGTLRYLDLGQRLSDGQRRRLDVLLLESRRAFPHDRALRAQDDELSRRLRD